MNLKTNLDKSIALMKQLLKAYPASEPSPMQTCSDLFEAAQRAIAYPCGLVLDKVMQAIAPIVSEKEIGYLLRDKHLQHLHNHRETCKQLIAHLIAMGIPVETDPQQIASAQRYTQGAYPTPIDTPTPAFTYQGKIYLDTEAIDEEAPIHEYTHLWATALRIAQPADWARVVRLMQTTDLWPHLEQVTPGKWTEDQLAEEVLALFSGREGKKRLAGTNIKKANILIQALQLFWSCVCEVVGYRFSTAEEVSNQVLSDFLTGTNPMEMLLRREQYEQYLTANNLRRDMFIGTIGAQGLDTENLSENRMENLQIAEAMETGGRTPREIKLATGWERGIDKFWRYEIPSLTVKPKQATAVEWGVGFELQELVEAPELFAAYPEARHMNIAALPLKNCMAQINLKFGITFNRNCLTPDPTGQLFTTNDPKSQQLVRICLTHELQHYIQHTEGFSRGGNLNRLKYYIIKEKEATLPEPLRIAADLVRYMQIRGRNAYLLNTYSAEDVEKMLRFSNRIYPFSPEELEAREAFIRKLGTLDAKEFEEIVGLAIEKAKTFDRWIQRYEKKAIEIYTNLSGEIEANNAIHRAEIPSDSLRDTLASETMDIPANKQYLYFANEIPTRVRDNTSPRRFHP